jgi:hypothetical protein
MLKHARAKVETEMTIYLGYGFHLTRLIILSKRDNVNLKQ